MTIKNRKAVVFGGSGFLGRYVVEKLAKQGYMITVCVRNVEKALFLKPLGVVGQISIEKVDITNKADIERVLVGASLVVNLVGILFNRGKNKFDSIHHKAAETIANLSMKAGVKDFVQMSSLGVNKSKAQYAETKFKGEKSVLKKFPEAIILRPSVIFGEEDDFFNKFGTMAKFLPFLPLIGGGKTEFQPVYVGDVAEAVIQSLRNKKFRGKVIELGGPKKYSFKELLEFVLKVTNRSACLVTVPTGIAKVKAFFFEFLPVPPLTRDQIKLLEINNVVSPKVMTFKDLKIEPKSIELMVPQYLERLKKR